MNTQGSQLPQLGTLPPETIHAYLDALAALSLRFGIVVASGSLVPTHADVGGYFIAPGGYLFVYDRDKRSSFDLAADLHDVPTGQPPSTFVSDVAGMTAHDRVRILAGLR